MIRVVIADDHALVRAGLRGLLSAEADMAIVGEAVDGDEVLELAKSLSFDVLLLDLSMPGRTGLDVLRQMKQDKPRVKVVVLTMHAEDQYALRVLKAGADGYLTKGRSNEELLDAVRRVAREGKYVTGTLADLLLSSETNLEKPAHDALSARELEILVMIGRGTSPSDVASSLDLKRTTVSTHLRRIKTKLGLETLGDVVQYAMRAGLVD